MAMPIPARPGARGPKITAKHAAQVQLAEQCRITKLPIPQFEYYFAKAALGRLWRFDCAWLLNREAVWREDVREWKQPINLRPDLLLALEIDGGSWVPGGGHHNRGAGLRDDIEKYWEAAILGWTVLRVMPEHVKKGQAVRWLERLFKDRGIIP